MAPKPTADDSTERPTEDLAADDDETPAVDALEPGDTFQVAGTTLVVTGRTEADAAPDDRTAADGPLYQADLLREHDDDVTHLYRPHNIQTGIDAGAEYLGRRDVDETEPFWCEACEYPHRDEERHTTAQDDMAVCSYGCKRNAEQERRQQRREERDDDARADGGKLVTDGGTPAPGDDDYRSQAEVVETDDGFETRPPTLTVRDAPAQGVREAVQAAVQEEPNAVTDPTLFVPDDAAEHVVARLTASYNETPPPTGDATDPWLPPYRAREEFDAALTDALPDDVRLEHKNDHATTFYRV